MKGYLTSDYYIAKKVLDGDISEVPSYYRFDKNTLLKNSRIFKKEYEAGRIIVYKKVPYIWDNTYKNYYMLTRHSEYIACMEYVNIPLKVVNSLEAISQHWLEKIGLPEDDLRRIRRSLKNKGY